MISAAGAAGVGYYSGGGGSDESRDATGRNYYTGAVEQGERPGQWSGKLAEALGLVGVVDPHDMEQVYERFQTPDGQPIGNAPRNYTSAADRLAAALAKEPDALPERIEEIRLGIERDTQSTCRGVDLTASVPKSVTVAYVAAWRAADEARADGQSERADGYEATRSALDGAILAANQAALDAVAAVATTRTGKHGAGYAGQWVSTPNLVIASFPQLTSRAGDPQFHVHNVVLNRAQTDTGKIGALDTRDLGQQRHGYSAVFDRSLAEELGAMGVEVAWKSGSRADGHRSWEIVGIDQEALDAFSQRRAQITKAMDPVVKAQEAKLGRDLNALERSRIAQTINLVTRESKDKGDIDWSEQLAGWTEKLTDDIGMGLGPIADHIEAMIEANAGTHPGSAGFSPDAVIAQARYELAQERSTWSRADAYLAVDQCLPAQLGVTPVEAAALTERLTDQLLASEGVVQVGGTSGLAAPASLMEGTFVRPSDATYAAPETLEAENLILRAAKEQRGASLDPEAVDAWLSAHYPTIQPDQRAAVVGLASTGAALSQLVGPAGTGKSFTAGALAGAWTELSDGGRVIGLATSQVATEVLRDDGIDLAFNLAAWQAMQGRIASGNLRGDEVTLGPRDLVVIDETSMVATPVLDSVRGQVEAAGARTITTGDPAQLGAVGAGGAMGLLAEHAETYTLTDVRRFSEAWERDASLGLRAGNLDALREYDLHGRLVEVDTMEDAFVGAARAAAAGILSDQRVAVETDRNADAYRIGDLVRDHLVSAGRVEEQGIILARSDQVAGIGDTIMTRQIDHGLGVLNGTKFEVVGTGEDGSLSVVGEDGAVRELPPGYVAQHVHLGYASTVHGVQGATVGLNYGVPRASTSAASLYVMSTRGADGNWLFVALQPDGPAGGRLSVDTEHGGQMRVEDPQAQPSAVSVLGDVLERDTESRAALMEQRADAERNASMDTLLGRIEEITHLACRGRLDEDLDRLVEDGVLSEGQRASLAADPSTDHLSRVCRAAEQAGMDPAVVLRGAIEDRDLAGSRSVAQVIAGRITSEHDVAAAQPGASAIPERVADDVREYLEQVHGQVADRTSELGSAVVEEAPGWATKALGPVPEDAMARLEWESKAGALASYREAKGVEESDRALPAAPGLSQTEARAAWWDAWEALGRPQETRVEAALSDGALQSRYAAWEREQAWAPAHADASLRQAALDAEEARQEAILARSTGDDEAAARWEQEAIDRATVADAMETVSDAREEWAAQTAVTQDLGERARDELLSRGLAPGNEPDRTTAEEWLEHQREVDAREEAVRDVTELDVPVDGAEGTEDREVSVTVTASEDGSSNDAHPDDSGSHAIEPPDPERDVDASPSEAAREATPAVDESEADSVASGDDVPDDSASRAGTAEPRAEDSSDGLGASSPEGDAEVTPSDPPVEVPAKSPAHDVAPIHPEDAELDALVATAHDASATVADRESEEAARDAWEAEQSAAPEAEGSPGTDDVAEAVYTPDTVDA